MELASSKMDTERLQQKADEQTSKIPSIGYLGFALGSMALSAGLAFFVRRKELANFVGLWVPTILVMGIYNKLVRMERHYETLH